MHLGAGQSGSRRPSQDGTLCQDELQGSYRAPNGCIWSGNSRKTCWCRPFLRSSSKTNQKLRKTNFSTDFSEIFRTRPNASERIQTRPNPSERIRTGPGRSQQLRKPQKTCENLRKTCENFAKNFAKIFAKPLVYFQICPNHVFFGRARDRS